MRTLLRNIDGHYSIIMQDDNKDEMSLTYMGADFTITMTNYHDDNLFILTEQDTMYEYFKRIMDYVKPPNQTLTWISEDYGIYENNHRLIIKEHEGYISIHFYHNPNKRFSNASICGINFCLSGSHYQDIANKFAILFNEFVNRKTYKLKPKS